VWLRLKDLQIKLFWLTLQKMVTITMYAWLAEITPKLYFDSKMTLLSKICHIFAVRFLKYQFMDSNLNNILKEYFSHQDTFDVADISRFYNEQNPNISQATINWRIHDLTQSDIIQRVGRGIYRLWKSNPFQMDLSPQIKKTANNIKKEFPYTDFCVWELAVINFFSHNLINFNLFFIDVERDAVDAVYYKLKETQKNVVNIRKTYDDISDLAGNICIRHLVSHAPLQKHTKIQVATLEKILVDLATDKEFFPFQGNEIFTIYENAFEKYTINESSMLRYAARKEKRGIIEEIIKTIKRQ